MPVHEWAPWVEKPPSSAWSRAIPQSRTRIESEHSLFADSVVVAGSRIAGFGAGDNKNLQIGPRTG